MGTTVGIQDGSIYTMNAPARKSDELYWFIKSELSKGKPFPSHQAMQEFIGTSCYAQAVLDLVLRGLIVRERCNKFGRKTKYTYRMVDEVPQ